MCKEWYDNLKCVDCGDIYWTSSDAVDIDMCSEANGDFGGCGNVEEKNNFGEGLCFVCHEKKEKKEKEEEERRAKEEEAEAAS